MPRQLLAKMTFDDLEDEVLFTEAALLADPDAQGLAPQVAPWLAQIDEVRAQFRDTRRRRMGVNARRIVANARLDQACTKFGDRLLLDVEKDTSSARWRTFFQDPVSRFVRMALPKQVALVKAWMSSSDPALAPFRDTLHEWAQRADESLLGARTASMALAEAWMAKEELVEDLTRERDRLHAALGELARAKKLARDWPDLFFLTTPSTASARPPASTDDAEDNP